VADRAAFYRAVAGLTSAAELGRNGAKRDTNADIFGLFRHAVATRPAQ